MINDNVQLIIEERDKHSFYILLSICSQKNFWTPTRMIKKKLYMKINVPTKFHMQM